MSTTPSLSEGREAVNSDPTWRAGSFRTRGGHPVRLAGWLYGHFGIDRRRHDGWHVNHIPTGFSVGCILGNFDQTRAFVEAIERGGDWNFTDPNHAPTMAQMVRKVEQRLGILRETDVGNPQGMKP